MRSILVYAQDNEAFEARLESALTLARTHSGHLSVHLNTPVARFVAMDPFGGAYPMTEALASARADRAEFAARLEERLRKEDVPFDIQESESEAADGLLVASRYADLTIVGLDAPGRRAASGNADIIGSLAIESGAPVLALPGDAPAALDGPTLIAWKDTAEAANAVRAAVPLLRRAAKVLLLSVAERASEGSSADAALRYLSRHDVHAEQVMHERGLRTTEEVIEATAAENRASLIVMGAYGHSRVRELLFGGVTRYMIDCGKFPLLLAH